MNKRNIILFITTVLLLALLCACGSGEQEDTRVFESGTLTVSFDYEKISGSASNQFAVWVEDMNGNYINTLYATKWTANGGYKNRPDSIAIWVNKSNLASMQKSEADAISGATPKAGNLSYTWDLTDTNGGTVALGEYKVFVEGTLRWKNYVIYSAGTKLTVTAPIIAFSGDSLVSAACLSDAS
jgi:hypothetical protein